MDPELQIAHSVTEIGAEAWDSLSEGRPFSSYRWYVFGESVLVNCPPTYLVFRDGKTPVARAAFWLKRQEWLPIASKSVRAWAERLLEQRPLFVCETPLACMPGLILPELTGRTAILQKIAQTAHELAKQSRTLCALFSYIKREEATHTDWPKNYAAISYSDAETSLQISWTDYESYIKHLAKSTRRNIRLHCKEADEMGITIKVDSSTTALDEAVTLVQNVETHHRVGHRPWTRAMLQNAHLVDSRWISAWIGDRLVGCCSLLSDGTAQTATLLGLDYELSQWIYVYYQLIYAVVRCAIESGCRELYGGGGAYELKRRLGFKVLPDDYMVLAPTGWMSAFLWKGSARLMNALKKPDSNQASGDNPENPI